MLILLWHFILISGNANVLDGFLYSTLGCNPIHLGTEVTPSMVSGAYSLENVFRVTALNVLIGRIKSRK